MLYTFPCLQLLEKQRESVRDTEDEVLGKGVSSEASPRCLGMRLQPPVLWGTSCRTRPATSTSLLLQQCQSGVSRVSSLCLSSEMPTASRPNKRHGTKELGQPAVPPHVGTATGGQATEPPLLTGAVEWDTQAAPSKLPHPQQWHTHPPCRTACVPGMQGRPSR